MFLKIKDIDELKKIANKIRINIIDMIYEAKSGHPGGSLSIADILTVLYFNQMNIDEKNPKAPLRDRLVLSKGHCAPALYSTLIEKGFINRDEIKKFRQVDGILQGHPDMNKVPGIDMTSGSLGQGLSVVNGMALSSKMNHDGIRVYCILGDGELEEGQIWEAAMSSHKYKLDNLCAIVDYNGLQIDGNVTDVKALDDLQGKFKSFGFNVINTDGNNIETLIDAFETAKLCKGMPSVIIAKTIKGKGVSFMEGKAEWHGKAPNDEEYNKAIKELEV